MEWETIEDVVDGLNLKAPCENLADVKAELKNLMCELAPNPNDDSITASKKEKERIKIGSAYNFAKGLVASQSMALAKKSSDIIVSKMIQKASQESTIRQLEFDCKKEFKQNERRKWRLPKIGSGVFGSICAFFWMFSETFEKHPAIGKFASDPNYQSLSIRLGIISGIIFLYSWIREKRDEMRIEALISEQSRKDFVSKLIIYCIEKTPCDRRFTFDAAVKVIENQWTEHHFIYHVLPFKILSHYKQDTLIRLLNQWPIVSKIPQATAEQIVKTHLLVLEERGTIHQAGHSFTDLTYDFNNHIFKDENIQQIIIEYLKSKFYRCERSHFYKNYENYLKQGLPQEVLIKIRKELNIPDDEMEIIYRRIE